MRELKPLSRDAVDAALAKAERYRFLNEPGEAESICLDILAVDPANQAALITLLLALTDQFGDVARRASARARHARRPRKRIRQGVLRRHHRGASRQGAAAHGGAGSSVGAFDWLVRGHAPLRARRVAAAVGQRRRPAALERLRALPRPPPELRPATEDLREIEMLE